VADDFGTRYEVESTGETEATRLKDQRNGGCQREVEVEGKCQQIAIAMWSEVGEIQLYYKSGC
jgi:hypothetical protein